MDFEYKELFDDFGYNVRGFNKDGIHKNGDFKRFLIRLFKYLIRDIVNY